MWSGFEYWPSDKYYFEDYIDFYIDVYVRVPVVMEKVEMSRKFKVVLKSVFVVNIKFIGML